MRWRRATEEQLESGIRTKKLENHDGYWYEQPDIWSKYLRRPASVKDMCLAQFAKMYQGFNPRKENEDNDEVDNDIAVEDEEL